MDREELKAKLDLKKLEEKEISIVPHKSIREYYLMSDDNIKLKRVNLVEWKIIEEIYKLTLRIEELEKKINELGSVSKE